MTKHSTQTNPEKRQSPSLPTHTSTHLKKKNKEARPNGLTQHQHTKTQTRSTNPTTPKHIVTNKIETNKQHTNTYTKPKRIKYINKYTKKKNIHPKIRKKAKNTKQIKTNENIINTSTNVIAYIQIMCVTTQNNEKKNKPIAYENAKRIKNITNKTFLNAPKHKNKQYSP